MSTDPSSPSLLDRLVESFLDRRRRGERPSIEEYLERYPELAEQIRDVFPALEVMEECGPADSPNTGPYLPGQAAPSSLPVRLGEYRILREVGRGGMGIVYEALQESLGRHVALKVLPAQARDSGLFLERFRREAQSAARLHHTNIVAVFGVGEHNGIHYYAMQFIRGQTLEAVLRELRHVRTGSAGTSGLGVGSADGSSLPAARRGEPQYFRNVARVGVQVAQALAYAHGQGVIHRDIKPANLMLDQQGTVWVTDFGLARAEGLADLTGPGDVVGTLRYMAPEQLAAQADARTDVYALGTTLYELATLRPAFDDPVRARLIERIRHHDPTPPRRVDPQVPLDLEKIILKATAREPGRRYQTAAALAEDLRLFLDGRPVRARPVGPLGRAWRWAVRRRRALLAAVGVAVLAVGLVLGGLAARDASRREEVRLQAQTILDALGRGDQLTARALLTEDARGDLAQSVLAPLQPGGEPPADFEIGRVSISGDDALVHVTATRAGHREEIELRFRRERGAWRLHGTETGSQSSRRTTEVRHGHGPFVF